MAGSLDGLLPKPVRWIGSSKRDLSGFPDSVRRHMGLALWEAQTGGKAAGVKPLRGFGGAGVLEIASDFDGDTFRAVYTVRFVEAVYVLHVFQKKSKRGIATPKAEMELISRRLGQLRKDHERWARSAKPGSR